MTLVLGAMDVRMVGQAKYTVRLLFFFFFLINLFFFFFGLKYVVWICLMGGLTNGFETNKSMVRVFSIGGVNKK